MWITAQDYISQQNEMYEFKREFFVTGAKNASLVIRVSAEARYKLYLNGELVSLGLCKGNDFCRYYETEDVSARLLEGNNVFYARVLELEDALGAPVPIVSVERKGRLLFYLSGILHDAAGEQSVGTAAGGWQVRHDDGFEVVAPVFSTYGSFCEIVDAANRDNNPWVDAVKVEDSYADSNSTNAYGEFCMCPLYQRPIPQLSRIPRRFVRTVKSPNQQISGLTIPAHIERKIILDAGALTTGYMNLRLQGGRNAVISLTYSECFLSGASGTRYLKNVRDDETGFLAGDKDIVEPDGSALDYESFWFKTFRYVAMEIRTSEEPLTLTDVFYTETSYPVESVGAFECSDSYYNQMWDISLRTLKMCMHETYEDCPYYEQLQYTMDTRLEILFCYQFLTDTRLADRAMEDFHASKTPDGLLQSRTPCIRPQIIPQFSLHFVFMLYDLYLYRNDQTLLRRYFPTADSVLNYFDSKIGPSGLVEDQAYWQYVDSADAWFMGVPNAVKDGPLTVVAMIYVCALRCMAVVAEGIGRDGEEYRRRADRLLERAEALCFRKEAGLYADGPDTGEYSIQTQIWAVLAGAPGGAALLENAFRAQLPEPSYSMSFYLFRALERAGIYEKYIDGRLEPWRNMIDKHCTTWVEDAVAERSECHGWGAVPVYELICMVLGIRPLKPGYEEILIKPCFLEQLQFARGCAVTKHGIVQVCWERTDEGLRLRVKGPAGIWKKIVLSDQEPYWTDAETVALKV